MVKCLHLHLANFLASGDSIAGEKVAEMLVLDGEENVNCTSIIVTYHSRVSYPVCMIPSSIQLDQVVISLEVLGRSSGPQAPPTTMRAFFDSPG